MGIVEIHKCLQRFWQPCHIFVFIRTISDLLLGCMIWLLKPPRFLESIVYICNDWILEIPMAKVAFVRLSGIVWPVVAILSKQGCKCRTVQICMFWILAVDIKSLFLVYWVYSWAYEICYWASLTGVLNLHCHIGFSSCNCHRSDRSSVQYYVCLFNKFGRNLRDVDLQHIISLFSLVPAHTSTECNENTNTQKWTGNDL